MARPFGNVIGGFRSPLVYLLFVEVDDDMYMYMYVWSTEYRTGILGCSDPLALGVAKVNLPNSH